MRSKFTERDTEDALYRSFWDESGSLHWGYFDDSTGRDFLKACANLNGVMAQKSGIGQDSTVLDLGCGNGNTATWLCQSLRCNIVGIDLSGVRINNANDSLRTQPSEVKARLKFDKASATDLSFEEGTFSHVWSQATIYHVHDKGAALREAYRVLNQGGILVFDDLIKPKPDISENAQTYVYDRLLFDTEFSFQGYQDALRGTGFQVIEAHDLSAHLKTSYQCLADITQIHPDGNQENFRALRQAYKQTANAIDQGELGWGMYVCRK